MGCNGGLVNKCCYVDQKKKMDLGHIGEEETTEFAYGPDPGSKQEGATKFPQITGKGGGGVAAIAGKMEVGVMRVEI